MLKFIKIATLVAIIPFITACSKFSNAEQVLPQELEIANQCSEYTNAKIKLDCYDFIAPKNSFAQLRLGLYALDSGNMSEAFERFSRAQNMGNYYANTLLSNLYGNGLGVDFNEKKSINLLKDVADVEPIAAYKLSYFYLTNNDIPKAIELLEFAASKGVKDAQKELVLLYSNNQFIDEDSEKSLYYDKMYQENENDFMKTIYGK